MKGKYLLQVKQVMQKRSSSPAASPKSNGKIDQRAKEEAAEEAESNRSSNSGLKVLEVNPKIRKTSLRNNNPLQTLVLVNESN